MPELVAKEQVRKVRPSARAERVVAPGPRIHVEELVPAVALVELELDLHEPVVVHSREKVTCDFFELRQLDGLHEGAGAAEVQRALSQASHRHRRKALSVLEEPAVTELTTSVTGYQLLNHHFFGGN